MRQVGDDGELLKIVVDKIERGNGIGDLLMEAVLDYTEEKGFKAVFLEVRIGNIAATRLYEKHGFKSVRIRKDYYNAPFEDALIMVRGDMW
jgi:ribosomal-protein-alanine N-acetyltransferase